MVPSITLGRCVNIRTRFFEAFVLDFAVKNLTQRSFTCYYFSPVRFVVSLSRNKTFRNVTHYTQKHKNVEKSS